MANALVTSTGRTIEIGRELGKGGEGAVYEVPANPLWVAKLYNQHHQADAPKQAKLRFMASTADPELLSYAAWPQETLHRNANGPVVGFLMSKVIGRAPIHMLYSPAHRRHDYPKAAWDFLLFAARNTAAAFAAIHRHGHVLGDVNQGNVLVGADTKVVLIDTDSFQINANAETYLCPVGVAHFTPPELQGVASFHRVPRTFNHDNFGLALLIFHLLFGGRHPYSGVPLRPDAGEALEKDIQAFRYVYAPDGQRRGFDPPPKSIPITVVPVPIQAMFTLAFTEIGARGGRPTADQWVSALDRLRGQLSRCAKSAMHVYPNHLGHCPWCRLDDHGVFYFLDVLVPLNPAGHTGFVLARVWAAVEAVPPPQPITMPNISTIAVTPTPLPAGVTQEGTIAIWRIVIVGIAIWLVLVSPGTWVFALIGAWMAWAAVGGMGAAERKAEQARRRATRDSAQHDYDELLARVRREIDHDLFAKKKQNLIRLRDEYQRLPEREKNEIANLHATAEARQRHHFLERHFIDSATISGVGPTKKAALRSFGIETAADVTWAKVIAVKGFGDVLTRAMMDWRKACERQFVFNPQLVVSENDRNAVRNQIATNRRTCEIQLNAGAVELQRVSLEMATRAKILTPQLQSASHRLAQALADMSAI